MDHQEPYMIKKYGIKIHGYHGSCYHDYQLSQAAYADKDKCIHHF